MTRQEKRNKQLQGEVLMAQGKREAGDEDTNKDNHSPLDNMTVEELQAYAQEQDIDIGNASSINGIMKKIKEHDLMRTGEKTGEKEGE